MKNMKKQIQNDRIQVTVLGGGREIGANSYLLQWGDANILLDAGQDPQSELSDALVPIHRIPNKLDAMIITHSHFDHIGSLPFIFSNRNPKKIIFSGGSIHQTFNSSHAYVANKFYSEMGIDISQITFEFKSRNTYENILFSKKIANPKTNEKWLLVTPAFHLNRSLGVSEKLEWTFIPYAVDFKKSKKFL